MEQIICQDCGKKLDAWVDENNKLHFKPPKSKKKEVLCDSCHEKDMQVQARPKGAKK